MLPFAMASLTSVACATLLKSSSCGMKCIADAQLPRHLARWLQDHGDDVVHTLDLPLGNRTPDADISALSLSKQRIVITKDSGIPYKLLRISTGNIPNSGLLLLFAQNISTIEHTFETMTTSN
jgi:predicted nuclease of predicted toxin-antitoxin system